MIKRIHNSQTIRPPASYNEPTYPEEMAIVEEMLVQVAQFGDNRVIFNHTPTFFILDFENKEFEMYNVTMRIRNCYELWIFRVMKCLGELGWHVSGMLVGDGPAFVDPELN